jgi:hypothetical protein
MDMTSQRDCRDDLRILSLERGIEMEAGTPSFTAGEN